ncbi:MAG TPA: hypothetical protein VH299_06705 [Solirubrobacterales bacterium]|nr:hypothetical protein [Solirubrobacterales bacterium]
MADRLRQKLIQLRGRLDAWLFLPAPSTRGQLGRWEYALLLVAVFVLLTIAELFRPGISGSLRTLWAEDGVIVMQAALTHGFFHEIFTVYPEYLIVYPRLIGGIATWFPLADAAVVVSGLASATIALSGIVIWFASAAHLRNPWLRATFAITVVLAPTAGLEAVGSAVYASWYMVVASFWVLLYRPRTDLAAGALALFLLLTALSNPAVWFLAPLAGLRLLAIRDRRDAMILGAYTLGCAAQVVATLQHPSETTAAWSHLIVTGYFQRILAGAILGLNWSGDIWNRLGWGLLVPLIVLALIGLVAGLWRARDGARFVALLAIGLSLLVWMVSMYQRAAGPALAWPPGHHLETGGRYAIIPAMLLLVAALVLLDDWLARGPRSGRLRIGVVAVAMAVPAISIASSFYLAAVGRPVTPWKAAVQRADARCATRAPEDAVTMLTSPPGYGITVPCEVVLSGGASEPAPDQG